MALEGLKFGEVSRVVEEWVRSKEGPYVLPWEMMGGGREGGRGETGTGWKRKSSK